MAKSISNYYESNKFLPETIDRTINGVLKKRSRVICKNNLNSLENILNGILRNEITLFRKSYWDYLVDHSKWIRKYYMCWKDKIYYKAHEQRCDCCGRFSPKKCYCEKCERVDNRRNFSELVKNKNFKAAINVLLNENKY